MRRFILTDMGNVVVTFKFRHQLVKEIISAFTTDNVDITDLFSVNQQIDFKNEDYYHPLDMGTFNVKDLWQRLVARCGVSEEILSYPMFLSLWCRHLQPIEGVVKLYQDLQKDFPLVAVSNSDSEGVRHELYHLIGAYGLYFKEVFISAERKQKKPGLLHDVVKFLEQEQVAPENCVYIDDIPAYTEAAEKLGIPAINWNGLYQPVTELENSLKVLGFSSSLSERTVS